jgi:hypothetical protein
MCLDCGHKKVAMGTPNHVAGVNHFFCLVELVRKVVNHNHVCVWFRG